MNKKDQFQIIIKECTNQELFRLKNDFTYNYPLPRHPMDEEIYQMILEECEERSCVIN